MSLFLLFTGFSFYIPEGSDARIGCIALGIYLFGIVYSPGEGPVPFTYSAEAYPLYVRTIGMSLATATTWFFNFVLSITWPSLQVAFKPQGAFGWYAAWNLVGWVLVLLFMPVRHKSTRIPYFLLPLLNSNPFCLQMLMQCYRKQKARRSRNSIKFSPSPRTSMLLMACARCRISSNAIFSARRLSLRGYMRGSMLMKELWARI